MSAPDITGAGDDDVTLDPDETIDPDRPPQAAADGTGERRGGKARTIVAIVLGVLAVHVLTATAVAVWATATVFNSEKVSGIVGDALAEPEVQSALADYLTAEVFTMVDIDTVLSDVLPDQLTRLEPVLAAGARTAVDRGINRVLANPDVQDVLVTVVDRAHARAMRLLEGDGLRDGIDVTDGVVTVNMIPLIGRGFEQLQQLGLFSDVQLPELSADGDPQEQIAALSEATGRDIREDFGQLVVYRSENLASAQESLQTAQRVFVASKRAVWLLVGLSVVLIAATVLVARNRWRATLWLGLGGVIAMVITRSAVHRVVDDAPNLAARPGGKAAVSAIVGGATTGLLRLTAVLLIVAVVAGLVALLRRRWLRTDLIAVAAVLAGAAVVAVLGITILSLLLGIMLGIVVAVVGRRLYATPPASEPPTSPSLPGTSEPSASAVA